MRFEQVRCDFCEIEIYAKKDDKLIVDHHQIEVGDIQTWKDRMCNKVFCSPKCLKFAVEEICGIEPTYEDYFQALAKKLKYQVKKEETKNGEAKGG